jgi:hypothetical protein
VGPLDWCDGRVEGLPYILAKVAVDLQAWFEVRRGCHVVSGIKSKPPIKQHLVGVGGGSRRGALDVDRGGPETCVVPEVAVKWTAGHIIKCLLSSI